MSDYAQHLLSYVKPERIMTLSCEHVIPPEQLLAVPVVRGESGAEFDFTFENRNSDRTVCIPFPSSPLSLPYSHFLFKYRVH